MKEFAIGFLLACFCLIGGQWANEAINRNKQTDFEGIESRPAYRLPSDACWEWAVGEDYGMLYPNEVGQEWNKRHEDIFRINGTDLVNDAYDRIAGACEEWGIE